MALATGAAALFQSAAASPEMADVPFSQGPVSLQEKEVRECLSSLGAKQIGGTSCGIYAEPDSDGGMILKVTVDQMKISPDGQIGRDGYIQDFKVCAGSLSHTLANTANIGVGEKTLSLDIPNSGYGFAIPQTVTFFNREGDFPASSNSLAPQQWGTVRQNFEKMTRAVSESQAVIYFIQGQPGAFENTPRCKFI